MTASAISQPSAPTAPVAAELPPVSRGIRFFYGLGAISNGASVQGLTSMLLLFYSQVMGLPAQLVGLVLMVSLIVDGLFDPLVGQWSDNFRSRWGRRHPFLYASAVPLAVVFYLLWSPPKGLAQGELVAYLLAGVVGVRLLSSLYEIPSAALAPELEPDYDRRTALFSYRFFFQLLGTTVVSQLAYQVFLRKDAHHPLGLFNREGYAQYGLATGVFIAAAILISTLGTHSQIPRLSPPARPKFSFRAMIGQFRSVLSNPSFVSLMVAGLIYGVATGLQQALRIYIYSYYWGLSPSQLGYLALMGLVAAVIAVTVTPALSRQMGKKRAMLTVFCFALVATILPLSLRLVGLMPANHTPALFIILLVDAVVMDTLGIIGFIIFASMIGDISEDNAVKTGERSEGLLFAANGLLRKCVSGVGVFLSGVLLEFVHFPAHAAAGQVAPEVLHNLILIYLPVTGGLSALAIASVFFYRIDRTAHTQNLERLRDAGAMADRVAGEAQSEGEFIG